VEFVVNHLDGTKIRLKNNPGEVIKPEDIKTVEGKGLPFHKQSFKFGNLFVMFKVTFPKSLTDPQVKLINTAMANLKEANKESTEGVEVCKLTTFSES